MNIIIAYDEKDTNLGDYFLACKENIEGILTQQDITPKLVSAKQCNMIYVDEVALPKNGEAFIFVAYSHGTEDGKSLIAEGEKYIVTGENTQNFKNALFYTNACAVGAVLGKKWLNNEFGAFIGYNESVRILLGFKEISLELDNFGIIYFLTEECTIYEAFLKMEDKYIERIQKMRKDWKEALFVADLEDAKNSLVFYGNKELKKQDFF